MKKAAALLLALALLCGLWGCGGCDSKGGAGSDAKSSATTGKEPASPIASTRAAQPAEPPPVPKPVPVEAVAAPALMPPGGIYQTPQKVSISVSTPDAQIHFTTDGSTPTASSPRYSGPIEVKASRTVKAFAIRSGMADSEVVGATYSIEMVGTVSTPVIAPPGGTFFAPQTVTISCPTAGAKVRCTTDGTDPVESSPVCDQPIPVSSATTVKAFASKEGMKPSTVALAAFKITGSVAPVTVSPATGNYSATVQATLSTATPGAQIRYTLDGTTPTQASQLYSTPLTLESSTTLFALAFLPDWETSPLASARYRFQASTPVVAPAPGNVAGPVEVTISTATPGAQIRYTTDGSAPGAASPLYVGPLQVASSVSLKAVAQRQGWDDSGVAEARWTMPVAQPVITPAAGTYAETQTVAIATSTEGATIRYTTDGSAPTSSSERYAGPFKVNGSRTVKAAAFREDWLDSPVASVTYQLKTPAPTITPASGSYVGGREVTISSPVGGAQLRYTTDGSAPTASSPLYSGPIAVGRSQTIKALAVMDGWEPSQPVSAEYKIAAEQPTCSPAGGAYSEHQSVTLSCATPGAKIHYTLDSSIPGDKSPVYAGPIKVARPLVVSAVAIAEGIERSEVVSIAYEINRVPDTGQTLCYDSAGSKTPCGATGQDGEFSILPMSFKDNGDGTVTDNVTGMLWQKQDDGTARDWEASAAYCAGLKLGGFSDWRLPTRRELMGIVDFSKSNPAINTAVFPSTATRYYWSSTESPFVKNGAWALSFDNGFLVDVTKTGFNYFARCVR